jgi:hypothetical protein
MAPSLALGTVAASGRKLGRLVEVGHTAAMSMWKPHALATSQKVSLQLRRGARVRTTVDLPDVPAGSTGRVVLANGFNWRRYRVLFENGVEVTDLDQRQLEAVDRKGRPVS